MFLTDPSYKISTISYFFTLDCSRVSYDFYTFKQGSMEGSFLSPLGIEGSMEGAVLSPLRTKGSMEGAFFLPWGSKDKRKVHLFSPLGIEG